MFRALALAPLLLSATAAAAPVDHSAFDKILRATVKNELVDYKAVQAKHRKALDGYLTAMAQVDHAALPKNERFAFYLNVYNATVLSEVAKRLKPGYSVSADGYKLFKDKVVQLKSGTTSLDDVEKNLTWNAFKDPRMHVGFVCGAKSCPPLVATAYTAKNVNRVLDANMKRFVTDGKRNRFDPQTKTARLSKIFEWYGNDFGGADKVLPYIDKIHPADLNGYAVSYLEYDWALNAR